MRKIKLHKISYKRVGFPTFLYDKNLQFYIDICTRRIISKKSSVSYTLYLHIYFLSNPLHASIEKDIAPVCYENNETKVTWGCYSLKNNSLSYYISLLEFDHRHTECD